MSEQASMFTAEEAPPSTPEWRRVGGINGGTCGSFHVHRTGLVVAHCGHPTALRPYHVVGHAELGCLPNLAAAKEVATKLIGEKQ